jgi:hypothetical protein
MAVVRNTADSMVPCRVVDLMRSMFAEIKKRVDYIDGETVKYVLCTVRSEVGISMAHPRGIRKRKTLARSG